MSVVIGWRIPSTIIVWTAVFASTGCSRYGPEQRVQVILSEGSNSARQQTVHTLLPALVDDSANREFSAWDEGPRTSVRLAPVADPEAFAARIKFGSVERIVGRTLYVRVDERKAHAQVALLNAVRFVKELPVLMRWLCLIGRVKVIAWWTGKPEREVFWAEVRRGTIVGGPPMVTP